MSATPVNTAATYQSSLLGGVGPAAGQAQGQGGGEAGGAAFLAILDRMLGLAAAGRAELAATGTDAAAATADPADPMPWSLAFAEANAGATSDGATADDPRPADALSSAKDQPPPAETAGDADANALLAGTVAPPAPEVETQPASHGKGPATTGPATGPASDPRPAAPTAGTGVPANGQVVDEAADRPVAERTAETRHAPAAQAGTPPPTDAAPDPELDGILAAFARRPAATGAATSTQQPVAPDDKAAQPARLTGRQRERGAGSTRSEEAADGTKGTPGADNRADSRADNRAADALSRLLAAGQTTAKGGLAGAAPTADGAGQDAQAFRPANTAPVLLTLNEVGAAAIQTATAMQAPAVTGAVPLARPNIEALAMQIAHEARDGGRRFEIALDPPELGRVEVRLEFSRDGRMTTHLLVDRSDTLDALARDARGLERALQAHGLKLEDGGVQYQLRDHSSFAQHQHHETPDRPQAGAADAAGPASVTEPEPAGPRRTLALGGLDVTI